MNVEVENLPNCIASLRIELPTDRVTQEWNEVVKGFRLAAKIPGFRPGKAPTNVIEAKFKKEIREELTKKLVSESTREAIKEKGLTVLSISGIDDVEITPEKSMHFTATLITAPEFDLPEYKGIPIKVPDAGVTDEELEAALSGLRERHATFDEVEGRPLEKGDFAVIDYETSLDGQPVLDIAPKAPRMLGGGKEFWIKADEDTFLKGFGDQLVGLAIREPREFDLAIAADYPIAELASKELHFKVTLKAIKTMQLPELNDEFAAQVAQGLSVDKLREAVKEQLGIEKRHRIETMIHNQIIDYLISRVECELPQSYVREETQRIMSDIVQQNQQRGISEELLRENEKEIINTASRNAKERLKANFVLSRIGAQEKIEVTSEEMKTRIQRLALQHRTTIDKLTAELDAKRALPQIREEVLIAKVLDFLTSNANVEASPEQATNG
jgi:trigger factor